MKNPPKSKFWKMKKFDGDIIILHMCNKNHNHMILGSGKTTWVKQNFLSFWAFFFTLLRQHPPPPPFCIYMCTRKLRKIKILKLKKTSGNIIILHIYTINDIIWCMIPEIWSAIDRICHSGPFFALSDC